MTEEYSMEFTKEDELLDRIDELEKENESLENVKNIYIGQLIKAKEIIEKMLSFFDGEKTGVFERAEQFLKETKYE